MGKLRKEYYIRVDQHDESKGLMQVSGRIFYEITQMNKTLPVEEQRFFAVQILDTPGHERKVFWETTYEISKALHREDESMRYRERMLDQAITLVPMDEIAEAEADGGSFNGSSVMDMDERLLYEERMERLDAGLSRRRHSDTDIDTVSMYMEGEQRRCVSELSQKYMLCTKTLYKYRQELDGYLRDFFNMENCTT